VLKILGNIVEMFIYASVYMIIVMIALKIVAAVISPDFEKKVSENDIGFSLILAALFVGMGLVLSAVIR
jgi:uncharacterized membrane protein YjfL (UPF0719 family)